MNVAMSADGNTVALGMPNYFHQEFDDQSGEVFVFRYNGSSWVRTRIPAIARRAFGRWVALNDAGDTLAIARGDNLEPSRATADRHLQVDQRHLDCGAQHR